MTGFRNGRPRNEKCFLNDTLAMPRSGGVFSKAQKERDEGVYTQYMTEDEQICNTAENSSAKNIQYFILKKSTSVDCVYI